MKEDITILTHVAFSHTPLIQITQFKEHTYLAHLLQSVSVSETRLIKIIQFKDHSLQDSILQVVPISLYQPFYRQNHNEKEITSFYK